MAHTAVSGQHLPTAGRPAHTGTQRHRGCLKVWPLARPEGIMLALGWAVLVVGALGVGFLITRGLDGLVAWDERVARWFEAQRTDTRNDLSQIGAGLADAYTLTPGVTLACIALVAGFRRWHDAIALGGTLLLEKAVFLPVTLLVDRDRPPIPQLDGAPPTSSYPSGHVAAAVVVYTTVAILVHWHVRHRGVRKASIALAVAAPAAVALSRLELGMHHVSDVVVGGILGYLCVLLMWHLLRDGTARLARTRPELPTACTHLDVTDIEQPRALEAVR